MKNLILGSLMMVVAILLEIFWIQTGAVALGVFSLIAALVASGLFSRVIRMDYKSSDARIGKLLAVMGLE